MSKNIGKVFEDEIKSSIPNEHWFYRFKDGTAGFTGNKNENVRFQAKNICDCQVMVRDTLFLLEMKNTMGTSLPFSNIKSNQIEGMSKVEHSNIKAYFLICFRVKERTFAIDANSLKSYMELSGRKSIPMQWLIDNAINIPMIKKKVKYKYDLSGLFQEG